MDLLTNVMFDILPFIKSRDLTLLEAMIMVDIRVCQMIQEGEEELNDWEDIEDRVEFFVSLNKFLAHQLDLEEAETKTFNNTIVEKALQAKPGLMKSNFVPRRLAIYEGKYPHLLEVINDIKTEVRSSLSEAA